MYSYACIGTCMHLYTCSCACLHAYIFTYMCMFLCVGMWLLPITMITPKTFLHLHFCFRPVFKSSIYFKCWLHNCLLMSSISKSVVNMKRCFLHHQYNDRFSLKTQKLPCRHKLSVKSVNANGHLRKKKRSIETSWMCEDFGDFTETVKKKKCV